jgi:hypothetical protein
MKEVFNMNDNEKKYFELEKEYRSELKKLNNKQNKIIAAFVVIFLGFSVLLFFVKIYFFAIICTILSFACYVVFYLLYEDSLKNALKGKVNKIFKEKNKIENLTNFEEYLENKIKKISILDLTPGQAITSSFIFCFINVIDKSFNGNGFHLNEEAIKIYLGIFIFSLYIIIFFDSYRRAYRRNLLSKKLIKIINEMITEEYRNNN